METSTPVRRDLDATLAEVLERNRDASGAWPGVGLNVGGDFGLGLLILLIVGVGALIRRLSIAPTARCRVVTIELTPAGVDLIDTRGQRETVPRGALGLQVANLWERRRILILKTWIRGPAGLRRTIALGTVDWIPIKSDAAVREWESFLGVTVDPQVTMRVT